MDDIRTSMMCQYHLFGLITSIIDIGHCKVTHTLPPFGGKV